MVDEVEAARLSIQTLMQENMALKIGMQHATDEAERSAAEAKHKVTKLECTEMSSYIFPFFV